ncbi:hypothetical protein SADUNF_Sadunf03G0048800 [Salix dunnii]|uniref:Uncharacterized protein n=1 Tax=Salix dunnii TaxID=1413687 RepID=A0A835KBC7_9ROSI|nr:hypothetical protein SADUNF_Sadunf03G0048800 [Salix dunnii]
MRSIDVVDREEGSGRSKEWDGFDSFVLTREGRRRWLGSGFSYLAAVAAPVHKNAGGEHQTFREHLVCLAREARALEPMEWVEAGKLQRGVIVTMSKATNTESWNFNTEIDREVVEKG